MDKLRKHLNGSLFLDFVKVVYYYLGVLELENIMILHASKALSQVLLQRKATYLLQQ